MSAFFSRRRACRRGYTLIELLVSIGAGSLVLAGLSSALYISTHTLTPDVTATSAGNRSSLALSQVTGDLRLALNFSESTSRAVTFTVPDRTNDGAVDTIRYSWSGNTGDPLLYEFNGGTACAILADVEQFKLSTLSRSIAATSIPSTILPSTPRTAKVAAPGATAIGISKPLALVPGNLMVAAIVVDGSVAASLTAPSGWTLVSTQHSSDEVTMAVWWKIAETSEPASYDFTWDGAAQAFGMIMRFSGVKKTAPINASAVAVGASDAPNSPSVTTTVPSAMIVRIGGFDEDDAYVNDAMVAGHTTLAADVSDAVNVAGAVSAAAAYVIQPTADDSGFAAFQLTATQEYVTVTLALTPEDGA